MKKTYMIPETEVIDMELFGMICTSDLGSDLGGDADNPAKARLFEDEESDW